jgi:chorismate synthase
LGTPISMMVKNKDARSEDYKDLKKTFRPGHADLSYQLKYGTRDYRGGGRASGRETVARVMAGAVAKIILNKFKVKISVNIIKQAKLTSKDINDSIGGLLELKVTNTPAGLGEPVFDKLSADLAKALISIGGIKAIEFGDGFKVADMKGSGNKNHGGILGGISYGEDIIIKLAVKPPSSIGKIQQKGRHDISLIPRIIPVIESMTAITLVDHLLRQNAINL